MKILAAMMCQNEILDLTANVTLLLPYVDSITIVDGGSVDGTIPYFRNWAKTEPKIRYFIHPWRDNFPEQRNNYLARIREIAAPGDWVLAVDPDEFLDVSALQALNASCTNKHLAEICDSKPERYMRVGFQCRSESYRGPQKVHENIDSYWKGLFYRWHEGLCYTHDGEGAVHERLVGADPIYYTGHHPELPALFYSHRKQENVTWIRGVRNYFCGGGGPNLGSKNHRWIELKTITGRLGIATWHQMHAYLLAGNIDDALKDWIIGYRREDGWDGSSEQREWFKMYYRLLHPEEEPEILRGEVIA